MTLSEPEENSPRQRIIDGARQAFLTFGYDGASMRTITEYTGYSQAGISHYFASKADLLYVAFNQSCERVGRAFEQPDDIDSVTRLYKIWRSLSKIRSDVALRTVVLSEASITDHPASARANETMDAFRDLIHSNFPEISDPQLMADIWEGLMLTWLYQPRTDITALLRDSYFAFALPNESEFASELISTHPNDWSTTAAEMYSKLDEAPEGSMPADERSKAILDVAMEVFGQSGYVGGSLRSIASALGVTHPALLRRFPSKDDLFRAVLQRHDVAVLEVGLPESPRESLIQVLQRAEASQQVPGLIRLRTAVNARSFLSTAPFHNFFVEHMEQIQAIHDFVFHALGEVDEIRPDLSPLKQGRILACLWDGVQIRWSLRPEGLSIADSLAKYIDRFLVPPFDNVELDEAGIKFVRETASA